MSNPASPLQKAKASKKDTDNAITKMKSHLDEISKLMENIQLNTNSIDNKVARCENIICTAFEEISHALQRRKNNLIAELHKTARNKKLSLLIQHNDLNSKYQESQNRINKIDESVQNHEKQPENEQKMSDIYMNNNDKEMIMLSNNFDLHFCSSYNKQLIQMINHFGSISANSIPILVSLRNNSKNFVVEIEWKLPTPSNTAIDIKKTQKLRIEWSNTKQLKWNHREFVISDDDKKQNQTDAGCKYLINVGGNGTYMFRVKHYYLNIWSKNSNTKSISIAGISFDFWSKIYHGDDISVEGKCIVLKNKSAYQTAFLSNVASVGRMAESEADNLHHWTFKIEGGHKCGSSRIFGIWRDEGDGDGDGDAAEMKVDVNGVLNTYFTNEKFVDPNSDQAYGKPFGDKCHEGDEIDMFLDLNKLKLFYKLNGIIYGKPIDVTRANYKAVVSFYYMDDRIRLLRYRKNT